MQAFGSNAGIGGHHSMKELQPAVAANGAGAKDEQLSEPRMQDLIAVLDGVAAALRAATLLHLLQARGDLIGAGREAGQLGSGSGV